MAGRIVRLPSAKETKRAEESKTKVYFPAVGRFFEKNDKTYITFNYLPDVVFKLQEDKPKEASGDF